MEEIYLVNLEVNKYLGSRSTVSGCQYIANVFQLVNIFQVVFYLELSLALYLPKFLKTKQIKLFIDRFNHCNNVYFLLGFLLFLTVTEYSSDNCLRSKIS